MNARKPTWQPSSDDYERLFDEQNPWHQLGRVPDKLAFRVERPLGQHIYRTLSRPHPRRFQLVLGPRRVGKTVCMYQTVRHLLDEHVDREKIWWLHMAHPLLMEMPLDELVKLVRVWSSAHDDQPAYLFIDEITYAKDWSLWLKHFYDQRLPIHLMATSSSTAALRRGTTESGVGRWEQQYLSPYTFDEYLDLVDHPVGLDTQETLAQTLAHLINHRPDHDATQLSQARKRYQLTGGFPELLLAPGSADADDTDLILESQRTLGQDAVERAIYKDIPQVFGVDNPQVLERLLYTLAGQITGVLSPSSICQTLDGLSQPTFDKYLKYLEQSFLVFTLQNYAKTEAGKQKRGRKIYFVDGAVRNAALQRGLGPLDDPAEMGLLLENVVAGHLHALGQQSQVRVHYWRDGKSEVDLIFDHPTAPVAFEIAASIHHPRKGIQAFRERFDRFQKSCYMAAPDAPFKHPQEASDGVGSVPVDLLLLAIGQHASRELSQRLHVRSDAQQLPTLFE